MKPTQKQIWKATVSFSGRPEWSTFEDSVNNALALAKAFERLTAHLDEPKPIPIRPEPTDEEWERAARRWNVLDKPTWCWVKAVSAEAYRLASERAKEKP